MTLTTSPIDRSVVLVYLCCAVWASLFSRAQAGFGVSCDLPVELCSEPELFFTLPSDGIAQRAADDLAPTINGQISEVCWWGTYSDTFRGADQFRITYYGNVDGLPGDVLAGPFIQSSGLDVTRAATGDVIPGVEPQDVFLFSADHAPVDVQSDQCIWIEIVNELPGKATWNWATRTDPDSAGTVAWDASPDDAYELTDLLAQSHFAFCVDVPFGTQLCGLCEQPDEFCFDPSPDGIALSDGQTARSADDFSLPSDTTVSQVCFFGSYAGLAPDVDAFQMTYFNDDDGLPGDIAAGPFVQSRELTVGDRRITGEFVGPFAGAEYEFTATHPPVALSADACYWIEIINVLQPEASSWFWSVSFDDAGSGVFVFDDFLPDPYTPGNLAQGADLAFCLGTELMSAACVPYAPKPSPPNCFAFSTDGATASDTQTAESADDFSPVESGSISELEWWGMYFFDQPTPDQFRVTYFADAGGYPGSIIAGPFTQDVQLQLNVKEQTGESMDDGGSNIYHYQASHPPVDVDAGTCYWIEIRNTTLSPGINWFWIWSHDPKGNNLAATDQTFGSPYSPSDVGPGQDFAFCISLDLTTEPCNDVPPTFSACGEPGAGSCCAPNGTPGCDDEECCLTVCNFDPFCCQFGWDGLCWVEAIQLCDCPDEPVAACCYPGGFCSEAGPFACTQAGGQYSPGFKCIDHTCTGPCLIDVDEDQTVGPPELAVLLSQWGPSPISVVDFDGDGVAGPADLAMLLGAWGPCSFD